MEQASVTEQVVVMDQRRCARLWERHSARMLLFARALLADQAAAEDVVQSVFVRLLSGTCMPSVESEAAYLLRAVRNDALNSRRGQRRAARMRRDLFVCSHSRDDADEKFRRAVEAELMRLPRRVREVLVLKLWGGVSIPEGATVLGVTPKAFERRTHRALEKLRSRLGGIHD